MVMDVGEAPAAESAAEPAARSELPLEAEFESIEAVTVSAAQAARDLRVVFGRLRRRLRDVAGTDDITPSQASVLNRVGKAGASTASALATVEGVRPQSMAATLAALEERGLIARSQDSLDGRRQIITLTPAGIEVEQGNRQARGEWLSLSMNDSFTEAERQKIIEAMAILERLTRL